MLKNQAINRSKGFLRPFGILMQAFYLYCVQDLAENEARYCSHAKEKKKRKSATERPGWRAGRPQGQSVMSFVRPAMADSQALVKICAACPNVGISAGVYCMRR